MHEWFSSGPPATVEFAIGTVVLLFALLFMVSSYEQKREARRRQLRKLAENEARLQLALWGSGQWFWQYDIRSGRLHCAELARRLGWRTDARLPVRALARCLLHSADMSVMDRAIRGFEDSTRELDTALRVRLDDGYHWLRWRGKVAVIDDEGCPLRVIGTCKDVTEERDAEAQLRLGAQVMESVTDAIVVFGIDFRISRVNASFTSVSGYSPGDVVGKPVSMLCPPDDTAKFERDIHPALRERGGWEGEHWKQHKQGHRFLARVKITRILDDEGELTHYVATFSDITRKKESEEQLQYLASHDVLTGLLNRTALLQRLQDAIERCVEEKNRIAVLFLDLDQFKQINDSFGHALGDEVLRAVANRLSATLRVNDVTARFGGDEFVVVLERIGSRQNVLRVVAKLTEAFRRELDIPGHELIVLPSIGISLYPDDATSALGLIEHADTAMYQTKKVAHATHSFYEGTMSHGVRDELKRENQLRHALDKDEFELRYQPIVDAATGDMTGMEALLRWQNPFDGMLMPGEFIHLAEQRGLIGEIGKWVLEQACRDLGKLNCQARTSAYVSVNVSSVQVRDPSFVSIVSRALAESGLEPRLLHIELTESLLMENSAQVVRALDELRKLGVHLALDDFGTGYSSLGYLRRFPISKLKIDRSFVRDITVDESAASIVTTIIALGHAMGLDLTAEGVETESQRSFLERHGCGEQQGFYYSAPVTLEDVQRLHLPQRKGPSLAVVEG